MALVGEFEVEATEEYETSRPRTTDVELNDDIERNDDLIRTYTVAPMQVNERMQFIRLEELSNAEMKSLSFFVWLIVIGAYAFGFITYEMQKEHG
jgi:hypothetical protein